MYEGKQRTAEPYLMGETTSKNINIHCYQTAGDSNSEKNLGWKNFILHKITNVEIKNEKFDIRPDYNFPKDYCPNTVISEVDNDHGSRSGPGR